MGWLLSQFNHGRGAPAPEMFISDATQGSLLVAGKVFRGSPAGESCVGEPGEVYTKHQLGERNVDGAAGCTVVMYWRVAAGGEFHCTFPGAAGAGVSFLAEFVFTTDQLQAELTDASEGTSSNGSANVLSGNMFPTADLGSLVICAAGVTVPDVGAPTMTTDAPAVEDVDLKAAVALQPHVWVAHRIDAAAAPPIQIVGHDSVTLESFAVQVMAFTADPVPARGFLPRFW